MPGVTSLAFLRPEQAISQLGTKAMNQFRVEQVAWVLAAV
jgi:hypothetical protein